MTEENDQTKDLMEFVLPPEVEAVYANVVRISQSPMDIVLDFTCMQPLVYPTKILSRVMLSPVGAKLLLRALGENLARYEALYGRISVPRNPTLADDLFKHIKPPEKSEENE